MKKILLIVSNHNDAALLPQAAKVIGKLGCSMLWVWHSPILGIDPEKECKVIDDEIKALVAGEKEAASRGDYKTADERKGKRESLLLNRSVEIRNAWKRVSEEGRKAAIGRYMDPILDVLNPKRDASGVAVRVSSFPEHQETALWVAALNEVKGILEKEGFVGGSFAMMWPRQLVDVKENEKPAGTGVTAAFQRQTEDLQKRMEKVPVPPMIDPANPPSFPKNAGNVTPPEFNPDTRKAELLGFMESKVIYTAKRLGIKTKGKENGQLVDEILAKETLNAM